MGKIQATTNDVHYGSSFRWLSIRHFSKLNFLLTNDDKKTKKKLNQVLETAFFFSYHASATLTKFSSSFDEVLLKKIKE